MARAPVSKIGGDRSGPSLQVTQRPDLSEIFERSGVLRLFESPPVPDSWVANWVATDLVCSLLPKWRWAKVESNQGTPRSAPPPRKNSRPTI